MDKQPKFYEYIDRKISFVNVSEDDASKMIKNIGVSDWHTYILLDCLNFQVRDIYLTYLLQLK